MSEGGELFMGSMRPCVQCGHVVLAAVDNPEPVCANREACLERQSANSAAEVDGLPSPVRVWRCAVCQWLNGDRNQSCQSCGTDRPPPATP